MMRDSKIEWTHHTFNPWWGCQRVSPGCKNCYAETFSKRLGRDLWGPKAERKPASESYWAQPIKWNAAAEKAGERHRVFCASMADVFEDRRELDAHRARLWSLIAETPNLDWLLLTKRPENLRRMVPWACERCSGSGIHNGFGEHGLDPDWCLDCGGATQGAKPWPNVWIGATVEDQKRAEERIPLLLAEPAAVRFLSCEPLLGAVDLSRWLLSTADRKKRQDLAYWNFTRQARAKPPSSADPAAYTPNGLHWVIVGGESGSGARMFDLTWARSIVRQCKASGVAVHVKQLGAAASDPENGIAGSALKIPMEAASLVSLRLRDRKGGDWSEWPEDLRVREYPNWSAP